MRAVLTLPIPDAEITRPDVIEALQPTSWLPRQDADTQDWRDAQVERLAELLPEQIRQQLLRAETVYIQVGTAVEGIVSLEKERTVVVRLFATTDDIESIKQAVTTVASRLPSAFTNHSGQADLALENEVVIRQNQDGRTLAKGLIVTPHTLRFRSYLRTERPRERRLLSLLIWAMALSFAVSLVIAIQDWGSLTADEFRGYGERVASALLVAALTTFVNLVFEYRDWRNVRTEVSWLFG